MGRRANDVQQIMVVLSGETDLQITKLWRGKCHKGPILLQDIHFIKGPVDILDHSSRHFSFGSKMGIDATVKWPEELEGSSSMIRFNHSLISKAILKEKFP